MDPCAFVRLTVDQLLLKLPAVTRPNSGAGVHPAASPCFCSLHLQDHPSLSRTTHLPLASASGGAAAQPHAEPVVLSLDPAAVERLAARHAELVVAVHAGQTGSTCGMSAARALGRVRVAVDVARAAAGEVVVAKEGWVDVGKAAAAARAKIYMVVRAEPDPRYVFQFGGEPECGPVVYQIPGGGGGGGQRQPVFSCRFSAGRRTSRSRSLTSESSAPTAAGRGKLRSWLSALHGDGGAERRRREQRKGWTVTIHDLSGSPVAAASMVTPFVPSPGSGRVSRANPGSWLILQAVAGAASWKPWARLEAWRERGPVDALGYRLELVFDSGPTECTVPVAESSISVKRGGQLVIDPGTFPDDTAATWPFAGGFVMGSTVEGEGKVSRPTVQVGVQHVACVADVAVFVALSAAIDLSMDACQLFSRKLRRELCQDWEE